MRQHLKVLCLVVIATTLGSLAVLEWRLMSERHVLTNQLSLLIAQYTIMTQQLALLNVGLRQASPRVALPVWRDTCTPQPSFFAGGEK